MTVSLVKQINVRPREASYVAYCSQKPRLGLVQRPNISAIDRAAVLQMVWSHQQETKRLIPHSRGSGKLGSQCASDGMLRLFNFLWCQTLGPLERRALPVGQRPGRQPVCWRGSLDHQGSLQHDFIEKVGAGTRRFADGSDHCKEQRRRVVSVCGES